MLFAAAATACLGIAIWQFGAPLDDGPTGYKASARRIHRQLMIQRQRIIWIDGALAHSLETISKIELGIENKPDAVQRPWTFVLREGGSFPQKIDVQKSISEIFDQTGGSLLILGHPGSGKTTLLLELTKELLDRAESDSELPIPVVFNLSTWGRSQKAFEQWLEDELLRRYTVPRKVAREWLSNDLILPLLDGLDEVRIDRRAQCVSVINRFTDSRGLSQIAVCSRLVDYDEIGSRLKLNSAVAILPIPPDRIGAYLESAGDQLEALRGAVEEDHQLRELLTTPLMLVVATLAYQHGSTAALRTRMAGGDRRTHLIESYIQRALDRPSSYGEYASKDVLRWLGVLAHQMLKHDQTVYHVEWMQPTWLTGKPLRALANWTFPVLLASAVFLITGYTIDYVNELGAQLFKKSNEVAIGGISSGWLTGLAIGLLVLIFGLDHQIRPAETIAWSTQALRANARRQLRSGLITGTIIASAVGAIMQVWGLPTLIFFFVMFELICVTFYLFVGGVSPALRDLHTIPNEGIRRSLRNALLVGLPGGVLVGIVTGYAFGSVMTLQFGLIDGAVAGGSVFLLTALHAGGRAWFHHMALRLALRLSDQIPLRWVRFLQYATGNYLLQRIGGGYIFVHRVFLEYFAQMHSSADTGTPAPEGREKAIDGSGQ
ncbi:NACHT domain-containing protein [Nonomuraea jiangxiensis]|uniref:NACHT domain-containing protein n=1 Tax=Nonomuraea jiangxiensis TaxID=633440 RepID=A0A1G9QW17_9ACTN|nr:NACHT domain-containing protein [Nonomuraea jiangxiensis]